MKISLVVSTYNQEKALYLCLKSIMEQYLLPYEIIIADDGSNKATREVIEEFIGISPISLIHIWQEDNGFRLSMIRNKAIAAASGDYILQIDGDAILHPSFVSDHLEFARKRTFVTGSRVYLDQILSEILLENLSTSVSVYTLGVKNFFSGLYLPMLSRLYESKWRKNVYKIRGGNMAFWRSDFIAINGYNEKIIGWGREDSELAVRLLNTKIRKRSLRFSGILYHLYHPEQSREMLDTNTNILRDTLKQHIVRCEQGIDQYLPTAENT